MRLWIVLFSLNVFASIHCAGQVPGDSIPKYAGNMQYFSYLSIAQDTLYNNDTVEIVHFRVRKKKTIETRDKIKVYQNHRLIHARIYSFSSWRDANYSYDVQGRLKEVVYYSQTGELTSRTTCSYSGDTIRATSSNWLTTNVTEMILDSASNLSEERTFQNGKCIAWRRQSTVSRSNIHELYLINCDLTGKITDTSEYIVKIVSARTVICVFYDSGKIQATDVCLCDSQNRYTECVTTNPLAYGDYERAGITTETYRHYGPSSEFLKKIEATTTYSYTEKVDRSWTIYRKGKWPDDVSKK